LVQEHISGRIPSRSDFQKKLAIFAQIIRDTHQSEHVIRILPERDIESYSQAGLDIIECISRRWKKFRSQVPSVVEYVEEKIEYLKAEVTKFSGSGLVASHNDVCNGNWLIADDGTVYLLDYEGMSLDAFQDGLLEKDELTLRKQAIDREQAQLQSLLAQAQEIRQQNQYRLHTVQDFADFSQRLLETLENPSPEVKSEVIRLLVDHIVVEDNTIVIHHIVPISENERLSLACLHGGILLQYF